MRTREIIIVPEAKVSQAVLEEICRVLAAGGVIVYPTETFYGLGAAGFSGRGVERIYRLKKREGKKPLSVIASDMDMVGTLTANAPPAFRVLAAEFWPGPLTAVLPAAVGVPDFLTGPGKSIAVRIPPPHWLRRLVSLMGQPLTATSANISGEREISDPEEIIRIFRGKVAMIINGGKTPGGAPSTLVDLTGEVPKILREGKIAAARVLAALTPAGGGTS